MIISGYEIITCIHESSSSIVYRGCRIKDHLPVILKRLKHDYPSGKEITRYKQEYKITYDLNIDNVIRAYSLKKYQNSLIIIFEDFGGISLDILLKNCKLTIKKFLKIAIKITVGLAEIHANNIVHKDLNSSNIVYNPESEELKIIDFGISTTLSRENVIYQNVNTLEGTLAYISPEQTGRINLLLDYRTDFYSLGVTFYELLTNKKPFSHVDLLELIYAHIAIIPVSPHQINPEIPSALSNIVMKMMAKNPEER